MLQAGAWEACCPGGAHQAGAGQRRRAQSCVPCEHCRELQRELRSLTSQVSDKYHELIESIWALFSSTAAAWSPSAAAALGGLRGRAGQRQLPPALPFGWMSSGALGAAGCSAAHPVAVRCRDTGHGLIPRGIWGPGAAPAPRHCPCQPSRCRVSRLSPVLPHQQQ